MFDNITIDSFKTYAASYGLNLLSSLIILLIGLWVAKITYKIIKKSLLKSKLDEMLSNFIANIIYSLIIAFVIISCLSKLGINTTSIAAIFAAAGLAIGLALQGSLSNLASGVMIVFFKLFKKGDFIEAGGQSGSVISLGIFMTTLKSGDNKIIIVPNGAITSKPIVNYTKEKKRRIDLVFGCGYNDNLQKVRQTIEKVIDTDKRILQDPKPIIAVSNLGDSSVDFVVRPWVKTPDYWTVRFELIEKIKNAFDQEGISIPYPQQDVHVHNINK